MLSTEVFRSIDSLFVSKSQVLELLDALDLAKSKLYSSKIDSNRLELTGYVDKLFKTFNVEVDSKDAVVRFLTAVFEHFSNFDYFVIISGKPISDEFLLQLKHMFEKQCNLSPIFDIKEDKKIVGGAIIEFKGFYFDLSLATQIEKYLVSNKNAILSGL